MLQWWKARRLAQSRLDRLPEGAGGRGSGGGPIQVLVFAPVAIRVRRAALLTLAILNVVIREAPG